MEVALRAAGSAHSGPRGATAWLPVIGKASPPGHHTRSLQLKLLAGGCPLTLPACLSAPLVTRSRLCGAVQGKGRRLSPRAQEQRSGCTAELPHLLKVGLPTSSFISRCLHFLACKNRSEKRSTYFMELV